MNADLHMAEDLKTTGKSNLFVIFGEPDIDLIRENDGKLRVKVKGVDVFKPQTGEVISDNADGIACWFIDTDYNEESFFVRHAYFLGANLCPPSEGRIVHRNCVQDLNGLRPHGDRRIATAVLAG
jgi:adenine-specific DNA-methyltransferase